VNLVPTLPRGNAAVPLCGALGNPNHRYTLDEWNCKLQIEKCKMQIEERRQSQRLLILSAICSPPRQARGCLTYLF